MLTAKEIAGLLEQWDRSWWGPREENPTDLALVVLDAIEDLGLAGVECLVSARRFVEREPTFGCYNPWWHLRWCPEMARAVPQHVMP